MDEIYSKAADVDDTEYGASCIPFTIPPWSDTIFHMVDPKSSSDPS